MSRNALLAGAAALLIAGAEGAASAAAVPAHAGTECSRAPAIQPAIVMFGLAVVRHHMLDTLTELVGRAASARRSGAGNAAQTVTERRPTTNN